MNAILRWWKRRRAFQKTYNELNRLSTRELADIGINRSLISRIALESARKGIVK